MGKVILVGATKGGVGKSVSSYNLAYSLASLGKKVLAVDFDSQANLTTCFGVEDTAAVPVTIGHLMMAQMEDEKLPDPAEYIMNRNGVDFIPSSMFLSAVDAKLRLEMGAERMLANIIEPLRDSYDYLIIDTCPALGALTINALAAADGVVITVNPQLLAMMGLQDFLKNGIKNTISGIYNTIKNGFTNAVNFIKNLASSAFSWGADIINGIVNGIKSCIDKVKDAVCSVADTIKSFLHFSVPDEGPLTEYESWMPDFMSGLAKGIENSKGMVKDAVSGLAADMVVNPQVNAGQMAMAGGGSVSSADMGSFVSAIKDAVSSASGGNGDIVIPVYLGGTMLDEVIVNAQQRANLRSGGR